MSSLSGSGLKKKFFMLYCTFDFLELCKFYSLENLCLLKEGWRERGRFLALSTSQYKKVGPFYCRTETQDLSHHLFWTCGGEPYLNSQMLLEAHSGWLSETKGGRARPQNTPRKALPVLRKTGSDFLTYLRGWGGGDSEHLKITGRCFLLHLWRAGGGPDPWILLSAGLGILRGSGKLGDAKGQLYMVKP